MTFPIGEHLDPLGFLSLPLVRKGHSSLLSPVKEVILHYPMHGEEVENKTETESEKVFPGV
jgi:hypothetical protein